MLANKALRQRACCRSMRSAQLRGTKRINGAVSAFAIVTVIQYMTLVPGLFRPMGGSGEHKGPYPVRTGRRRKALNCNPEIDIIWAERSMRTARKSTRLNYSH